MEDKIGVSCSLARLKPTFDLYDSRTAKALKLWCIPMFLLVDRHQVRGSYKSCDELR
jgi:hypothetical protein